MDVKINVGSTKTTFSKGKFNNYHDFGRRVHRSLNLYLDEKQPTTNSERDGTKEKPFSPTGFREDPLPLRVLLTLLRVYIFKSGGT